MAVAFPLGVLAQQRLHVHTTAKGAEWDIPVVVDSIVDLTVSDDLKTLQVNVRHSSDNGLSVVSVPFSIEQTDSMTIEDEPELETKDHYQVFQIYITTIPSADAEGTAAMGSLSDEAEAMVAKEYMECYMSLNGRGQLPQGQNLEASPTKCGSFTSFSANAQIRGRGNSSLLWYEKKPYRLKLNTKHKMLGLAKAKSWVLLANYRDVTDLMNTFVFEVGQWLGLPYTNHTRYVELFLNGDYKGVYQLTEQVQQNKNRVAVSDSRGILINLDVDDGPSENPFAGDNFTSKVFKMPVCVKYPDDEYFTENTVDSVKAVLAELEEAIKAKDYARTERLLDIPTFIKYLQLQEFVYNVELSAPRSIYMHKDGDGPWVMGPLWDFDAGYDFDWSNMYTGHTFFKDYRETVMGTNPLKRNGNYNYVPQFFTNLFGCREFVEQYKAQWASVKDSIVSHSWEECMKYVEHLRESGAMKRELERWPIEGKDFEKELKKMHEWLTSRAEFLTELIANIPVPDDDGPVTEGKVCGTVICNVTMDWYKGYSQNNKVRVKKSEVLKLMGITESDFNEANVTIVPLMDDGSEGINGTNGVFGGWFDADGNPGDYPHGHVYIEVFQDLWNWNCGLYQENCWDDKHSVTMQYQYPYKGTLLKVNVKVNFGIRS